MTQAIPNTKRIMARAVKGFREDMRPEFQRVADAIGGILLRHADDKGLIPIEAEERVVQAAGDALTRLFVDGTQSAFAADGVTAVTPYAALLNKWYVYVVAAQVMAQRAWMEKHVPEDVFAWLGQVKSRPVAIGPHPQPLSQMERGVALTPDHSPTRGEGKETPPHLTPNPSPLRREGRKTPPPTPPRNVREGRISEGENPFLRMAGESDGAFKARLEALRIFQPNPLAEYEPMHTWVDPNGYVLSRRIWQNSTEMRTKLDMMLRDAIREGISAVDLAKQAENWLLPGLEGWRTRKPYGRDGSYPAMRLARTEIAAANNQAAYIAGSLNPYVGGIDIARSLNGDPTCLVCPIHATIDLQGERVADPYPVGSARIPPNHPHCMCRVESVVADDAATVTAQLRAAMLDERAQYLDPYLTPVQAETFIEQLIGQALMDMLAQVQQLPLI